MRGAEQVEHGQVGLAVPAVRRGIDQPGLVGGPEQIARPEVAVRPNRSAAAAEGAAASSQPSTNTSAPAPGTGGTGDPARASQARPRASASNIAGSPLNVLAKATDPSAKRTRQAAQMSPPATAWVAATARPHAEATIAATSVTPAS